MTVVLRHNEELELNRCEYSGSVSLAELVALAEHQAANPAYLSFDSLNVIMPSTDFRSVDFAALDAIFARYLTLLQPMEFLIMRRSAWLCESPMAAGHLRHWLEGRDTKGAMSSDVRMFDTFAEAGVWLVLTQPQARALEHCEGFSEVVRIEIPPEAALAR